MAQHVEQIIDLTLGQTPVDQSLIIAVDLGPFKYNVDNGAPIRKAAFVLLENITEKFTFNQQSLVDVVIKGFADKNEDVQQQCLRFMNRLLIVCPNKVIE